MKTEKHEALSFLGIVMIIYGIAYAILGTLSLMGTITGVLPGHEKQEIVIIVISYIITLVSLIGGIASVRGEFKTAKVIGTIFIITGLTSLTYTKLTQEIFNNFDCIAIVLGAGIFYLAYSTEFRQKTEELKKQQEKKKATKKKETSKSTTKKNTTKKKSK